MSFLRGSIVDHLRQQLAGAAHERNALLIFVRARTFADKHQRRRSDCPSQTRCLLRCFAQAAAVAIADIGTNVSRAYRLLVPRSGRTMVTGALARRDWWRGGQRHAARGLSSATAVDTACRSISNPRSR